MDFATGAGSWLVGHLFFIFADLDMFGDRFAAICFDAECFHAGTSVWALFDRSFLVFLEGYFVDR